MASSNGNVFSATGAINCTTFLIFNDMVKSILNGQKQDVKREQMEYFVRCPVLTCGRKRSCGIGNFKLTYLKW